MRPVHSAEYITAGTLIPAVLMATYRIQTLTTHRIRTP